MFFMFNSDVICEYPLEDMIAFHKAHGKEGTIMGTPVEDPSRFGVIVSHEDGQIEKFVEKPQNWVGNKINAGLYLFNTSIIKRIPNKPTSIERIIFPVMAAEGDLYMMELQGYWMDVGQPPDYLKGQEMYIKAQEEKKSDFPRCKILALGKRKRGFILLALVARCPSDLKTFFPR